jgi:guanylate kinase
VAALVIDAKASLERMREQARTSSENQEHPERNGRIAAMIDAKIARRGILLVISSPSGAGKTTLATAWPSRSGCRFRSSYTTRRRARASRTASTTSSSPRMSSRAWSSGTSSPSGRSCTVTATAQPSTPVNRALEDGNDYLFDIDYQGGAQIRRQWPQDSVLVFILPPSMAGARAPAAPPRHRRARGDRAPAW